MVEATVHSNRSQGQLKSRKAPRSASGLQPLQQQLQQHIAREDHRIKDLTEAILHDFLPGSLKALCPDNGDPADALTPENCRAVASACLIVASLMNAPPGFLEFLLCLPWTELGTIYCNEIASYCSSDRGPATNNPPSLHLELNTAPQLKLSEEERRLLVNLPLTNPILLDHVLDFIYQKNHRESVPPTLLQQHNTAYVPLDGTQPRPYGIQVISAVLDGATPLHAAAIRGNPAQVEHLLVSGADAVVLNCAGEMPLQLVPSCGQSYDGTAGHAINENRKCKCMGTKDQEAWECRSHLARTLILKKCVASLKIVGFLAWLKLLFLCLMCMLGLWGNELTLKTTLVEKHVSTRLMDQGTKLVAKIESTVADTLQYAQQGKEALQAYFVELDEKKKQKQHADDIDDNDDGDRVHQPSSYCSGPSTHAEAAFAAYSKAIQCMDSLQLDKSPHASQPLELVVLLEEMKSVPEFKGWQSFRDAKLTTTPGGSIIVAETDQSVIIANWAQAAYALCESCSCIGCCSVAAQSINTAIAKLIKLHSRCPTTVVKPDSLATGSNTAYKLAANTTVDEFVASNLAFAVHQEAKLLLATDVKKSATRAAVWRVEQCLSQWRRLKKLKSSTKKKTESPTEIQCLEAWASTAAADLDLIQALQGSSAPLSPMTSVADALPASVLYDVTTGLPALGRAASWALHRQLEDALIVCRGRASGHVLELAEAVTEAVRAELHAGDTLRALLQQRAAGGSGGGGGSTSSSVINNSNMSTPDALTAAIQAAERFPALADEVAQGRVLKQRWAARAKAQAEFEAEVEAAAAPAPDNMLHSTNALPSADLTLVVDEVATRVARLEAATELARQSSLSSAKARKLIKELQAQATAAEAALALDGVLNSSSSTSGGGRKGASTALKTAVSSAEAAAAAATSAAGQFNIGSLMLLPRIAAAKQALSVEKAAEALARAASTCTTVADLPRLEAAIIAARKVQAHELDPEAYKSVSELRSKLESASKVKFVLENAVKVLQRSYKQDDIQAVEEAIQEARDTAGALLESDIEKAQEAITSCLAAMAAAARLDNALEQGAGTASLARAIKEATAAGVTSKVADARKVLKAMQALESALHAAVETPGQHQVLQCRIQQAEVSGVPAAMVTDARATLCTLLLSEARSELDATLKGDSVPGNAHSYRSVSERLGSLKSCVERVGMLLTQHQESSTTTTPSILALLVEIEAALKSNDDREDAFADGVEVSIGIVQHDAVAVWFEPLGSAAEADEESTGGNSIESSLTSSNAWAVLGDTEALPLMLRAAIRRLKREKARSRREERANAEESRVRRMLTAAAKAKREMAEKAKADKARAERAERKAAQEAAKAQRRERELKVRLERESQRQSREAAAREHFVLLQKQRKLLAQQAQLAQQAHQNQLLAAAALPFPGISSTPSLAALSGWSSGNYTGDIEALNKAEFDLEDLPSGLLESLMGDDDDDLGGGYNKEEQHESMSTTTESTGIASATDQQQQQFVNNSSNNMLVRLASNEAVLPRSTWSSQDGPPALQDPTTTAVDASISQGLYGLLQMQQQSLGGGAPLGSSNVDPTGGLFLPSLDLGGSSWLFNSAPSSGATNATATIESISTGGASLTSGTSSSGVQAAGQMNWEAIQQQAQRQAAQRERELQLIAALDAAKAQIQAQQRPCRFFSQGFCREGDRCRFSHQPMNAASGINSNPPVSLAFGGGNPTSPGALERRNQQQLVHSGGSGNYGLHSAMMYGSGNTGIDTSQYTSSMMNPSAPTSSALGGGPLSAAVAADDAMAVNEDQYWDLADSLGLPSENSLFNDMVHEVLGGEEAE